MIECPRCHEAFKRWRLLAALLRPAHRVVCGACHGEFEQHPANRVWFTAGFVAAVLGTAAVQAFSIFSGGLSQLATLPAILSRLGMYAALFLLTLFIGTFFFRIRPDQN